MCALANRGTAFPTACCCGFCLRLWLFALRCFASGFSEIYYYDPVSGDTRWERPGAGDSVGAPQAEGAWSADPAADADADAGGGVATFDAATGWEGAAVGTQPISGAGYEDAAWQEPAQTRQEPAVSYGDIGANMQRGQDGAEHQVQSNPMHAAAGASQKGGTGAKAKGGKGKAKRVTTVALPAEAALPEGWQYVDDSAGSYYWNEASGETSWERPEAEMGWHRAV